MLEIVEKGTDRENIFKVLHLDIKRGGTKEEWMDLRLRGREGCFGGVMGNLLFRNSSFSLSILFSYVCENPLPILVPLF